MEYYSKWMRWIMCIDMENVYNKKWIMSVVLTSNRRLQNFRWSLIPFIYTKSWLLQSNCSPLGCLGRLGPCCRRLSRDCWQSWELASVPSILCFQPITVRGGLCLSVLFSLVFWVDLSFYSLAPLLSPSSVGTTPWSPQSSWIPGGQLLTKAPFRRAWVPPSCWVPHATSSSDGKAEAQSRAGTAPG